MTERLHVGPWHRAAARLDIPLDEIVSEILTERSTSALPEHWQGDYSPSRSNAWIEERDNESPTLLGIELTTGRPVALVILYDTELDDSAVDVRLGYVIAETAWNKGLATELVGGLVKWARVQASIQTLTGGVEIGNQASARVLVKNGFELVSSAEEPEAIYQLHVESGVDR